MKTKKPFKKTKHTPNHPDKNKKAADIKLYPVAKGLAGQRIDRVLPIFLGLSRKKAKMLLDQGRIFVNGHRVVIASWEMKVGDQVEVKGDSPEENMISAEKYFLKVVFEDDHLLVVEKDAGLPCETSPIATRPTLVAVINAYLKRSQVHLKHHYLGLIHRLDQDTSGLMVYSKNKEANKIADQFKRHTIRRNYLAVVRGRVEKDQGKVESYLKKSDLLTGGKKVAAATADSGTHSLTHFRVKERYADASLVELTLNTGRTHQIRVHMAEMGHPVIGDRIYGEKRPEAQAITFPRQALHASYLSFIHPVVAGRLEFTSELPKDMRRLVERLRLRS
jgi:23S rRNA pseudouridine1911/1915/1917 synthase